MTRERAPASERRVAVGLSADEMDVMSDPFAIEQNDLSALPR
jgi:hypothetical protein